MTAMALFNLATDGTDDLVYRYTIEYSFCGLCRHI